MGGKSDETKGRLKEAAGDLTGDENLKREGRKDRVGGRVKEGVSRTVEEVKKKI